VTNTDYRRGGDLERAAKKILEDNGYYAVKSAGSKGKVDVLALKAGEVLMVQCKTGGYLSPAERGGLRELARRNGATALAAYWHKDGRAARRVQFVVLLPLDVAREWDPDYGLAVL
jgi:Holliday junction resolvase